MELREKVVAVTGGANGIGAALVRRFHDEGTRGIAVLDMDDANAGSVAAEVGGLAVAVDVSDETQIGRAVRTVEETLGPIDLFCSNAGVGYGDGPGGTAASASNELWQKSWQINVMAHVYAARAVLPGMLERGGGYFLNTVSAAGLLNQIGDAAYSTTKHAAIGFAEALSITHGDDGIGVSVLCPQYVDTKMIEVFADGGMQELDGVLQPEEVARHVVAGLRDERFLILPHPQVAMYMERKTADYDRWLKGMRRLRQNYLGTLP